MKFQNYYMTNGDSSEEIKKNLLPVFLPKIVNPLCRFQLTLCILHEFNKISIFVEL